MKFKKILILAILYSSAFQALAANAAVANPGASLKALVFGNSKTLGNPDLRGVDADAEDMSALLLSIGFDVTNVGNLKNLTKREMETEFNKFHTSLKKNTIAVVYFSGHGVETDGKNFLYPIDAVVTSRANIYDNLIDFEAWLNLLQAKAIRTVVVILDACRDMPSEFEKSKSIGGLAAITELKAGTKIIFAAAPGHRAQSAPIGERNSIFTGALIQASKESFTTFDQVIDRAAMITRQKTEDNQIPYHSGAIGMSFRLTALDEDIRSTPAVFNNSVPPVESGKVFIPSYFESCEEISVVDYSKIPPAYHKEKRCK